MFNLVQFVENHSSSREIDQKKEKFAEENHDYPVASQDISSQPSVLGEKDKEVSMTKIPSEQKPIATKEQNEPLALAAPVSGKEAVTDLSHNPSVGRNQAAPKPLKPETITRIPRPFSKIAYKRNTGIEDNNLLPYTNTEDTEMLAKLGYTVDKDLYLFLPRGEEREDLYSYVEKVAGVSKDVARCIDNGTAFSSEHLKDMDYEVPEGYEIKGDLVCPIEKKAEDDRPHHHLILRIEADDLPNSEKACNELVEELAKEIDMKIVYGPKTKHLTNPETEGYSTFAIITTSHISLHTWNKTKPPLMQIDIFSCNAFSREKVEKYLRKKFKINKISDVFIDRTSAVKIKTAAADPETNALVVSGIHGDEPAGDKAAQKLKDSADVVSHVNPSDKRRFEGKDINRHFDKPTEGKVQKTILDIIRKKKPSKVIALHEDDEVDKPYAYSSESLKDETREALKDHSTASSAHGDKAEDGVISKGKNPPDGSLEKALDDRDIPRVTLETPSKAQDIDKRVKTQLDVVKKLLGKKADLTSTQPAMSLNAPSITGIHSPINIQTSTQGQTTPVDNTAKNNALASAGKSFLTDQAIGTIPNALAGVANFTRGTASRLGSLTNKAMLGANKLEAGGHIAAGELSARTADDPRTAMTDRAMSYASSLLPLVTKNPIAGTASYLGNTLYDAANAADVYHKNMPSAPPSMGTVPEQKFNINLKEQPPVDFRLTQPKLRDQYPSAGANIAKQGEATHELKSSNIKAVGYDKENKKLEVAFHSGGNYTYNDVPKSLVDRIKKVKSPGKFFHKHIKRDNPYKYERIEKESSVLSSHPGTVTNLESYQPPEMSKMDIIGSLLLGENYIPQRREYESIYESTQRSKRNTDYITHHPLLTDNMSKNLSNVFGGDVNKAYKDVSHMLSNPEVMSQFKQAESIFDRLEKKIYLEMQNER